MTYLSHLIIIPKSLISDFYKELINKHDIDVSKSLFIGNDSTTDIKGAKECRMDAFYVKSNISPRMIWLMMQTIL